jgi:epoxide hydrolase
MSKTTTPARIVNLYWVTTDDHDEDWFILAKTRWSAEGYHIKYEGYEPGDARAELILRTGADPIPGPIPRHAQLEDLQKLGFAQGGDWGTGVTTALGHLVPPGLAGIHLNWQFVFPTETPEHLSFEEQRAVDGAKRFLGDGNGYFRQQATRPQTIGYALSDSPAGQAMWIYEKFYSWTDNNGSPEEALSRDQMLDDISLYWFTNTAASSARIYCENKGSSFSGGKLTLPVAATVFPREIYRAPKSWAEQTYSNLIYWNEAEHGGHFAAFEQPDIFVEEMRSAFRKLREQ